MDKLGGQSADDAAMPWVRRVARYGYAAKGVVYVVVGWLAFQAAMGVGGQTTDSEGAIRAIFRQPMGPFLLLVVGIGLFNYSAWRFIQALLDVEEKGSNLRGLLKRLGYLASGGAYGTLGISALRQAIGIAAGNGRSQEDWTALILAHPVGRWIVAGAGVVVALLAINAAVVALSRMYRRKLKREEMNEAERAGAATLAVVGLLARGIVFGLVAVFFMQAAWESNPERAGGLSDVLVAIASQPQGPWLLGLTAIGLMSYGLYELVEARFRRIPM